MASPTRPFVRESPASDSNPVPVNLVPSPSSLTEATAAFTEASKTVAATGTPEALGASATFKEVQIFPLRTNTGDAFFGTVSTNDSQHGTLPAILTAPPGKLIDISLIYIDVSVNGEGVRYLGVK